KNDKAVMSPEGVEAVQKVAEDIKKYPGEYTLAVNGYTSLVGSRAHNMGLSMRRAKAVAKVLVDSGIPEAAVTTAGFGPDNPVADNKTREGAAKNRRVEIEIKVTNAAVETNTIVTAIQD
ncbi:MAG TPA: OmpA family protein, partial [Holophaga sp.]|nr:OmpA family protein [Holophaga sp.]